MGDSELKRALVLSGGGGRGAYQVGVLRFLEKHEWWPDVYVGTSIGAVNAAAMVSGHTSHSLWALWQRLRTDDVQRQSWSLFSLSDCDHLLDTSPLRETLTEGGWIDLEHINDPSTKKHLRITTMEMETGRLRVFGNSSDATSGSRCCHEVLTIDHILASCSIPMVYPSTEINGVRFWDGGVIANTPLGPAIDAGANEIIVVLMTPWENEADRPKYVPSGGIKGLLSVAQSAFEWALLASFQADLKLFKRTNEVVRLGIENERLRAENEILRSELEQRRSALGEGEPLAHREIQSPIIVSPQEPISLAQILQYEPDNHEELYNMGFADAENAWADAGRHVE